MNLMIVEDELRLLNNLARNIPWEEHGIELVATAGNGMDALILFDQMKPNIVLLDIHMPDLDGLSVAKRIAQTDPLVKIILLSGHDDFKYAQIAIELHVMKYLLKPSGNTEVLQAVLEARESIRSDLEAKYNQELMQKKWAEHLPRLQDIFYQSWIEGKYAEWEIEQRSRELGITLPVNALWAVTVVDPDPLTNPEGRFSAEDIMLVKISLLGIAKEFLDKVPCFISTNHSSATVLVFFDYTRNGGDPSSANDFMAEVHLHTTRLLSVLKEFLKITASAGIGRACDRPNSVCDSYREACLALEERVVHGHDIVVPYRDKREPRSIVAADIQREQVLVHALETGQREKAIAMIDKWVHVYVDQAMTSDEVHQNILHLSSLFVRIIQLKGWSLKEIVGSHITYFYNLRALTTKDQTLQWLYEVIDRFCLYVNDSKHNSRHELIRQMIEWVDSSINEDIGLHEVASKLYINASYLSRLFKQQMGQSFTSYIVERKMKLAMQWLTEGMKVSETAELLGYRDFSYFTKVFRKTWGVTPADVKNKKA
ncbi:two-component system response regulator YesN [Paenibacillus endophyticus]|uniref:Two-component system response regulator YesN n=1 Tax=Paenibacillus endophyticus TaxID=1294268 RepID=A0A7W5CAW2_9BACL|nr:response regulator [Paenibacillus endophyticus]MBB3153794.1 two-component system response regulator YesN [Paenibacillus endophyticus]